MKYAVDIAAAVRVMLKFPGRIHVINPQEVFDMTEKEAENET